MTGHHIVKRFYFSEVADSLTLPSGWKPFAVYVDMTATTSIVARKWAIVARKWVRDEAKG